MPLSSATTVGILRSAPGHKAFSTSYFSSPVVTDDEADALEADEEDDVTLSSNIRPERDNEDSNGYRPDDTEQQDNQDNIPGDAKQQVNQNNIPLDTSKRPEVLPFDLNHDDAATNSESPDDATSSLDDQSELL
jgi:hypothetical protein